MRLTESMGQGEVFIGTSLREGLTTGKRGIEMATESSMIAPSAAKPTHITPTCNKHSSFLLHPSRQK